MEQSCHLIVVWFHEDTHGIKLYRTIYTHSNEIVELWISKWALWIISMSISCLWYCTLVCKFLSLQEVWKAHRISQYIFFNFLGIHNNFKIKLKKKSSGHMPLGGFISGVTILSNWFVILMPVPDCLIL